MCPRGTGQPRTAELLPPPPRSPWPPGPGVQGSGSSRPLKPHRSPRRLRAVHGSAFLVWFNELGCLVWSKKSRGSVHPLKTVVGSYPPVNAASEVGSRADMPVRSCSLQGRKGSRWTSKEVDKQGLEGGQVLARNRNQGRGRETEGLA